jgi:predicted O-methyltransferase YrrM
MGEHKLPREKKTLIQRLVRRVVYKNYGRNLLYQLQMRALEEAADYVQAHMSGAMIFESYRRYIPWIVSQAPKDGLILEFGVAGGHSIRHIAAAAQPRLVHGFDSFEGLPEDWAGHLESRGAFSQKRKLPRVPSSVALHVGWFNDTLPGFLTDHPGPIALLHVDCDLYSGTKYILDTAGDRIRPGTVILFDEYFNYPSWREHEYKAWQEFVTARRVKYSYIAFTAVDGCVAVRVDSIG